jgi:hypothetical protein
MAEFNRRDNETSGQIVAARLACESDNWDELREIIKEIKDIWRTDIAVNNGRVENTWVGFGRRDWVKLEVTLPIAPGQSCKPQTIAILDNKTYNAEAAGKATSQSGSSSIAIIIPAEAVDALVSCSYSFPANTPVSMRFGSEFSGSINGTVALAALATQDGSMLALPTGFDAKVKMAGQTVSLTLDKTSPFNKLEADAAGNGYLGVALVLDSKSPGMAGDFYMGETMYFRFPVHVAADWSSVRFEVKQMTPGSELTPVSEIALTAADEPSGAPLGGDPCADVDGNGIRDGADSVSRATEVAGGCTETRH